MLGGDPQFPAARGDGGGPPRRVGENDDPLAPGTKPLQTVDRGREGAEPVVEHAPEVDDVAVVIVGQFREPPKEGNRVGGPL